MYEKKSLADNRRHLSRASNRGWAVCLSIPLTVRASQSNLAKSTVTNDSISGHLVAECSVVLSFDETVALKPGYARKKSSHYSGAEKAVSTEELEKRATLHSISTINSNTLSLSAGVRCQIVNTSRSGFTHWVSLLFLGRQSIDWSR